MRSYACTCNAHEPATLRTSIHVIIGNFCICIPKNFRILVYKMRKCCRHYRTVVRKKKNIMPTISHQNAIIGNWTRRPLQCSYTPCRPVHMHPWCFLGGGCMHLHSVTWKQLARKPEHSTRTQHRTGARTHRPMGACICIVQGGAAAAS